MAADILDTLRSPVMALYEYEADGGAILLRAADEIGRLRDALERVSTSNNLPFIWEVSKTALNSSATLTSSVVKDCLTTDCATRRQIIDERDRTFALMLARAETAEARADALAGALRELVKINEDHNRAIERIIGSPPGWNDSYLDRARVALAEQEKDKI